MSEALLIFGYGNPSRGDDALGPELLGLLEGERERRPGWETIETQTDFQLQIEHDELSPHAIRKRGGSVPAK